MRNKIIIPALLWLGAFFYSGPTHAYPRSSYHPPVYGLHAEPAFQYKIIPAPNYTWGYDILRDNKIFIHQPNKPGLPGQEGFSAKKDAVKVARLVISKIKLGEMPPTVSPEELKALNLTK